MNAICPPQDQPPAGYIKPDPKLWKLIAKRCLHRHTHYGAEMDYDDRFFLRTLLALGKINTAQWLRVLDIAEEVMPNDLEAILGVWRGEA
jgi:hypothetical protein